MMGQIMLFGKLQEPLNLKDTDDEVEQARLHYMLNKKMAELEEKACHDLNKVMYTNIIDAKYSEVPEDPKMITDERE